MRAKKITKFISVCLLIFSLCVGCSVSEVGFDALQDEISLYTEEDKSDFTYEALGENLIINSDISSLEIVRGNSDEIEVSIFKRYGGSDKEALKEEVKKVSSFYENGTLNIEAKPSHDIVKSNDINTIIKVPKKIESIEVYDSLGSVKVEGDYKKINADVNIGDFSYIGEVNNCDVNVSMGDIDLKLKNVEKDYSYNAITKMGDININVPDESNLNLVLNKNSNGDVDISKKVIVDKDGTLFKVETTMGDVSINK